MRIVLVYVGNKAPLYVYKNLEYLVKVVGVSPVLITDNQATYTECSSRGIDAWMAPDSKELSGNVYKKMGHPKEFRIGFWFNTVARFGAIAAYMEAHPMESILQVESDVWLSPNFPFEKFTNLKCQIAFGLETAKTGSAALLYIRDLSVANKLIELIDIEFENNSFATDMTILGKVFSESLLDTLILPSIPVGYDASLIYADEEIKEAISRNSEYFGGIFDPITLGLFITGEDPKNHRGVVRMYQSYNWHNFGIGVDSIAIDHSGFLVIGKHRKVPVFSIHNHAKEKKLFSPNRYLEYLSNQVRESVEGPRGRFILSVFISQVAISLKRRFQKSAKR